METSIQNILRDFYAAVTRTHNQSPQKIQGLDHFFSRFHNFSQGKTDILKQNKDAEYETMVSIGDIDPCSFNSPRPSSFSSSMLYTFLLSNHSTSPRSSDQNCSKIISQTPFTDFSFFKVLLYAVFVNFLHINKQVQSVQDNNYLANCLSFAEQALKKVKIAMVSAAQWFKASNKKKYTKIRYLYDELVNYAEKQRSCREEYIKVIIEELDEDFVHKTFDNLKSKCNQLLYSKSMCSDRSLEGSLQEDGVLFEIGRALEYLKLRVVLWRDNQEVELSNRQDLQIAIEEMPNGAFKLRQIISTDSSQGCFSQ